MTQLAALHYGAIPVVARVSGIADTVSDADPNAAVKATGTGIQFAPVTLAMLENAIARASALYRQRKIWRQLQINGMATDVSCLGTLGQTLYGFIPRTGHVSHVSIRETNDEKVVTACGEDRYPYTRLRRRRISPSPAKPAPKIARLAGSGTGAGNVLSTNKAPL